MEHTDGSSLDDSDLRILNRFFSGGRLKSIPAKQKKRHIILRFLASKFERGRMYTESEVNDLLLAYHPDCASLRRWLVDSELLHRQIVRVVDARALMEGTPEVDYKNSYWRP